MTGAGGYVEIGGGRCIGLFTFT